MSQQAQATDPSTVAAAAPPVAFSAPLSAPTANPTTASAAGSPSPATAAAPAPAASPPAPAAPAPAPTQAVVAPPAAAGGAPPPAAAAAPNGMATQYGVVVWPSLPGLQQAAVGVAPPASPPSALSGLAHRMPAPGRGGMIGSELQPQGLPAGAVAPPGIHGDWGGGAGGAATPAKARRSKVRANSGGKKSEANNRSSEVRQD